MSEKKFSSLVLDRRQALGGVGGLGAFAATSLALGTAPAQASKITPDSLKGPYLDLTTQRGNMIAMARMQGDIDVGKSKYGWYAGNVMGVRKGEKIRDLFRFEGFGVARLQELPDGKGYQKLLREVGYYVDSRSGEIMEEWENIYTGETVRVVSVANDPFNFKIEEYFPEPPSYGGLNEEKPPRIPLQLPWEPRGSVMNMDSHIHLLYPSALQPNKWPRESPGPMTRVSELFMYQMDMDNVQDPNATSITSRGSWGRITPWLPWMLMDQAEGHIVYSCFMGSAPNGLDDIDPKIVAYTEKNYPKFLDAPTEYYEPSLSSLENYALEQTPAPKNKSKSKVSREMPEPISKHASPPLSPDEEKM